MSEEDKEGPLFSTDAQRGLFTKAWEHHFGDVGLLRAEDFLEFDAMIRKEEAEKESKKTNREPKG